MVVSTLSQLDEPFWKDNWELFPFHFREVFGLFLEGASDGGL